MENKEYGAVDILKLVCAACVCATHAGFVYANGMFWTHGLTQTALIVFFICSGYFAKNNNIIVDLNKMKRYIKRLLLLLAIWVPLYLIWDIYILDQGTIADAIELANEAANEAVILNNGHLWYIGQLIAVMALLTALQKDKFTYKQIIIALIIYMIKPVYFVQAFLGVAIGIYMADHKNIMISKYVKLLLAICIFIPTIIMVNCGYDLVYVIDCLKRLMFTICAVLLMSAMLDIQCESMSYAVSYTIRKLSTIVYIIHVAVINRVYYLYQHILPSIYQLKNTNIMRQSVLFVTAFIVSVMIGIMMIKLSEYRKLKWMKYLY